MTGTGPFTLVVKNGYAGWREQALRALAAGWPPESVTWIEHVSMSAAAPAGEPRDRARNASVPGVGQMTLDYTPDGTEARSAPTPSPAIASTPVRVSKELASLLQDAALCRSPQRWAFLYRVLWRWQHGDRAVASAADEDGARLNATAKSVRRAQHDMIAYVRFRQSDTPGMPEYLAWYEPEHDVLAYAAEHFARRMGRSTWLLGTPQGAALWNGDSLQLSDAPADAAAIQAGAAGDQAESLWLAYYKSIFNPARLNESALHRQMPVRFWKGLPEGPLIPGMIAEARNGARRVAQAEAVAAMAAKSGKQVAIDALHAQPVRAIPSSLDQCRRCELWRDATQAVPGEGPSAARIMLVGEQPGDQEDLAGRAFVGPAGQVLEEALRRAGVPRDDVFLTNAVKHFKWIPRGKRRMHKTPAQREVAACMHWLDEELARVRPAVIVTLGATALGAVLRRKASMRDYLDAPVRLGDAWLVATWHPSYALRVNDDMARGKIIEEIARAIERGCLLANSPPPPGDGSDGISPNMRFHDQIWEGKNGFNDTAG